MKNGLRFVLLGIVIVSVAIMSAGCVNDDSAAMEKIAGFYTRYSDVSMIELDVTESGNADLTMFGYDGTLYYSTYLLEDVSQRPYIVHDEGNNYHTGNADIILSDDGDTLLMMFDDDEVWKFIRGKPDSSKVIAPTYTPASTKTPTPTPTESMTLGEQNAYKSAQSYLKYSSFSKIGLIEQLEYEGYSHAEAVFAVEKCAPDWNEQAAKSAESYLKYSSFSKIGLIEQLEYEGFTHEQALYGVTQVGY